MQIHELLISIKLSVLVAGLLGAFITFLRKNEGTIQAKLIGFITALLATLYFMPFLAWIFEIKFGLTLHAAPENLGAFVCGLLAQKLTEDLADNPMETLAKWRRNVFKLKRIFWNGEDVTSSPNKIFPPNDKTNGGNEKGV